MADCVMPLVTREHQLKFLYSIVFPTKSPLDSFILQPFIYKGHQQQQKNSQHLNSLSSRMERDPIFFFSFSTDHYR